MNRSKSGVASSWATNRRVTELELPSNVFDVFRKTIELIGLALTYNNRTVMVLLCSAWGGRAFVRSLLVLFTCQIFFRQRISKNFYGSNDFILCLREDGEAVMTVH